MSIASGYKKFKKYILTSSGFQLVSHWTKANTLEFDDGKTAQDKLGAIDGISSSRESNSDKIAASTALVSELNSDLGGLSFYEDNTGKYVVGADSVPKKLGSDLKIQTKSATYPMAGVNGEQTVDFSVVFDGISGYKLAYAGIQQLNTYISNGTIKYVEFTSQRISGNTVTWSVHTQRGTGGGNNTCVVQGIFIPT